MSATTFTAIPATCEVEPAKLMEFDPVQVLNVFRADLYAKGASASLGWLIVFIHGEHDPIAGVLRLHLHGACSKTMEPVLDRLRALPRYKSERFLPDGSLSPVWRRIRIRRKPLVNLPAPITYLLQSFWPERPIIITPEGKRKRVRTKRRVSEPVHSIILTWMDKWQLKDMSMMIGLRVTKKGLTRTRQRYTN